MTEYHDMTPEERFAALDRLAGQLFETGRWQTALADRYGITRQAVGRWKENGPPSWVLVAMQDAVASMRFEKLRETIRDIDV